MWNQRYQTPEYVYGKNPNDFLKSVVADVPRGKLLTLGEGEGRNAVFMAKQGFEVTAIDLSNVGLAKARKLALDEGVKINTIVADLTDYDIPPDTFDVMMAIFLHLPPAIRKKVHQNMVLALNPGGYLIMELFSKEQLPLNTGGPKSLEMLMDIHELMQELDGLHFIIARKLERDVQEGSFHNGKSFVIQILATKP